MNKPCIMIMLGSVFALAACRVNSKRGNEQTHSGTTVPTLRFPSLADDKPAEYPGLHQVVAYADGLYSGAAPEGPAAFQSLRAAGIKTIISVDGAAPDVELARAEGLRYVHLPIGYNGMTPERTLEIARAVRDLPGPVYLHCHHGKHRSAGAAGAVAVTLGRATNEAALKRMAISGTAPNYTGLFACVKDAHPASEAQFERVDASFPSVWKTSGFVQGMVEIDEIFDHLKLIEKSGWAAPKDHPDLVPAAEVGRLADLFRTLTETTYAKNTDAAFREEMHASARRLAKIEEGILNKSPADALSAEFKAVAASCKDCHAKHRD